MTNGISFPEGVVAAICTPVDSKYRIDYALMFEHYLTLLDKGCHGIVFMGTTGEATSFSVRERKQALEELISRGADANHIMASTGACALSDTVELTRHATELGCGGVLVMPPFYFRTVGDDGLYRYYAELAERTSHNSLKIFLYHFPRMSGIDMSLDLVERLITDMPEVIVGMKNSSGDKDHTLSVYKRFPGFRQYAGTERLLRFAIEQGGSGCISATANYSADVIRQFYDAFKSNSDSAEGLERKMIAMRMAFEGHNFAAAVKGILARQSGIASWNTLRPPLMPVDESALDTIENALREASDLA